MNYGQFNLGKLLMGSAAAAALTFTAANGSMAWSVPVGKTKVASCTQEGKLSNGDLFTISTNVYQAGDLYTYQYDLTNVNDKAGLFGMAADFSKAPDYGTSGMKLFFGDAPNANGIVYHDGSVGSAVYGTGIENTGSIDYQTHTPTMAAYSNGDGLIVWQMLCTPLKAKNDTVSQFGNYGNDQYGSFGYLYVQTTAKPTDNTLYVADTLGNFGSVRSCTDSLKGDVPAAVPEPSSVASIGLGSLGVLGLLLRSRKRAARQAS